VLDGVAAELRRIIGSLPRRPSIGMSCGSRRDPQIFRFEQPGELKLPGFASHMLMRGRLLRPNRSLYREGMFMDRASLFFWLSIVWLIVLSGAMLLMLQ
jgi:hypothetical protein